MPLDHPWARNHTVLLFSLVVPGSPERVASLWSLGLRGAVLDCKETEGRPGRSSAAPIR
jgi:hypothetical protein